jgi:hypothetical protein
VEKAKLEPVAYWSHRITGIFGALLFLPYSGVFWMAMVWPAQLFPAIFAIVADFFFCPTAILSLLLLLTLFGMVSGMITDLMIAGYSFAAIVTVGHSRIKRRFAKAD